MSARFAAALLAAPAVFAASASAQAPQPAAEAAAGGAARDIVDGAVVATLGASF